MDLFWQKTFSFLAEWLSFQEEIYSFYRPSTCWTTYAGRLVSSQNYFLSDHITSYSIVETNYKTSEQVKIKMFYKNCFLPKTKLLIIHFF